MIDFLTAHYLVIKALHLIFVISWMAGLLYLPRLFVYHAQSPVGSQQSETFKMMESRLSRIIMTPAMVGTFIFGGLLIEISGAMTLWLHVKLLLVLALAGLHVYFMVLGRDFAMDRNQKSARFLRILNEVPALLMIFIIFLVVMKPF
jgi:putative membrane protein